MRSNPIFLEYFCDNCDSWDQVVSLAKRIYKDTFSPGGYITIHGSHLFKKHFDERKAKSQEAK